MLKKKIFTFIVAGVITFTSVLPLYTDAIGPVIESGPNMFTNIFNTGQNVWQVIAEDILIPAAIGVADKMLAKMSNDLINWSNNGFDGQPGFINNYGELLKGVEFSAISSSFNTASGIANATQQQNANAGQQQQNMCEDNARTAQQNNLASTTEPQSDYDLEYDLVQCKINVSTNTSINDYNTCFQRNTQAGEDHATQITTGPSSQFLNDYPNWTNLGPSDQGTWINDAFGYYEFMHKRNQCFNLLQQSTVAGNSSQLAQSNYNLFQSGQVTSTRAVAETVANIGTERLNENKFEQLAQGGGDLTLALLGSQGRKDDFKNDITAGGWEGILSLTSEGSTDLALSATTQRLVNDQVQQETSLKEASINLPTKQLDKTTCVEYKEGPDGIPTDECAREITETPADIVASQLNNALNSEAERGNSFSDSLVSFLVKKLGNTIDSFIDKGLGNISSSAGNAFFSTGSSQVQNLVQGSSGGTDFQSQFNVLGIETNSGSSFLGGTGNTTNPIGGLTVSDGIGGPEDPNAQVIINFQEDLEQNLGFAIEEKSYYDDIRKLTAGVAEVIYQFEQCIPGPDYDWEERFNDDTQDRKLALSETRAMVQDPQVTIPGGTEMRTVVDVIFTTARSNKARTDFRRDQLNRIISTMNFIRSEIETDFNTEKQNHNANLVLFESDWILLSNAQKISIFEYLVQNQYYINPSYVQNNGATILSQQAIDDDEENIKSAAIMQAWDIWRDTTPADDKLELREAYFAIINNLSSRQFISVARAQFNETKSNIENSYAIVLDCLVFKTYALGISRAQISAIITNPNTDIEEKISDLHDIANGFRSIPVFGGNPGIKGLDISNARTDSVLKAFLESEEILQSNNANSVFLTPTITSANSINSSILGFPSETEKIDYFDTFYPTALLTQQHADENRTSIAQIYKYDIMWYYGDRGTTGYKGTLFCRMTERFDRDEDRNDNDVSWCFNGTWYTISLLQVKLLVSDI